MPLDKISPNERLVLDLVRRSGSDITRAEITRATELTAQSVSRIVDQLVKRGFLALGETVANGRGQPSASLRLVPDAAYSLGVSIMTDCLSVVLMDLSCEVVASREALISDFARPAIFAQIAAMRDELCQAIKPGKLIGLGVGITGHFVGVGSQINTPDPLGDLALTDLDQQMQDYFGLPVFIDNDGNTAAVGESLSGIGLQHKTFAYIYIAKGIGGSLVIDNKVYRGARGNAGEFAGVLPKEHHDQRPTLELLRTMLAERGVSLANINELIANFDPYWPGVEDWMTVVRPHLISIISAISAVFDPEVIVLGGRIPAQLAERLMADVHFYNVPRRNTAQPLPKLVVSQVRGDATAIGAAATQMQKRFFM